MPATVCHIRLSHVAQMLDSFSINCDESFVDPKGSMFGGRCVQDIMTQEVGASPSFNWL